MVERAALFGGTLEAGRHGRGFRVAAVIPLDGRPSMPVGALGVTPIRVLLVDDQQLVRIGFRMILADEPDIEVVGEAADGRAALDAVSPACGRTSW